MNRITTSLLPLIIFSFIFVISSAAFAQSATQANQLAQLKALVLDNNSRIAELQSILRDYSGQNDIILQSKSSEKTVISALEQRILVLETELRKLEAEVTTLKKSK